MSFGNQNNCSQSEVDKVVTRCRKAVEIHGGMSDKLSTLRKYYAMLERCVEGGALAMIEGELDKLGIEK